MLPTRRQQKRPDPNALRADMTPWPESWAGCDDDKPFGRGLTAEFGPFVQHLCEAGLSLKTVRRHMDNLWVIGGEVVRQLHLDPKLRKRSPAALLFDAIKYGEAPLATDHSEDHQEALDATARKLLPFLSRRPPR